MLGEPRFIREPRFPYDPTFILYKGTKVLLPTLEKTKYTGTPVKGGVIGEPGFPYLVPLIFILVVFINMVGVVKMNLFTSVFTIVPRENKRNLAPVPPPPKSKTNVLPGLRTSMIQRIHNQRPGCGSCGR